MITMVQERSAWDFVAQEKPEFTLAVVSTLPRSQRCILPRTHLTLATVQSASSLRPDRPLPQFSLSPQHLQSTHPRSHDRRRQEFLPTEHGLLLRRRTRRCVGTRARR